MGNCHSYAACTSRHYEATPPPEETDARRFAVSSLQNFLIFKSISLEDDIVLSELSFMPGDDIVFQGDTQIDMLYLLRSGKCVVLQEQPLEGEDGDGGENVEVEINMLTKGCIIGERAFLCQSTRTATVRAVDQCSVVGITRTSLEKALGFDSIDPQSLQQMPGGKLQLQHELLSRLEKVPLMQILIGTKFIRK